MSSWEKYVVTMGLLGASVAFAGAPPLDVKAEFGEQVAADIDQLGALKAKGQVSGVGQCLKGYMEAVLGEKRKDTESTTKQRYRACTARCTELPTATVEEAKPIAQRYATLCREKSGVPAPAAPAPVAEAAPVTRFPAKGACDTVKLRGSCREYASFGFRREADEKKVCEAQTGEWVSGQGCPTAPLRGSCAEKGTGQTQRWYNVGPNKGGTTAQVKDACDAMLGTFKAP